jgi:hypothetical protein
VKHQVDLMAAVLVDLLVETMALLMAGHLAGYLEMMWD